MKDQLPEAWSLVTLPEICAINPPKPPVDALDAEALVTFVPMPAVHADQGEISNPLSRPFSEVRRGFTAFREADVIFAKITPCMENGKAAIARGLLNGLGFGSTEFHVLRSTGAVLPDYLFYFIRQEAFRRRAENEMTGSVGQKRVPATFLEATELPLPPLAEQQRIIAKVEALLARVNAARQRLTRVPAIMKRFRQSVLAAACSGRLTADWREDLFRTDAHTEHQPHDEVPAVPVAWRYEQAKEIVEPDTVISYGIVLPGPNQAEGIPYIRGLDIDDSGRILTDQLWNTTPEIASKHKRSVIRRGDVLLCVIRHLRVAVVPEGLDGANLTQGTVRLRPSDRILADYLALYLTSPQAQGWMKARYIGMAMPRINVEHARTIPIAVPPCLEQHEIVRRVQSLFRLADSIEKRAASATARAEKLTQAILAKAFRGELVPTEAELARREGRGYEPASALLERIRAEREKATASPPKPRRRSPRSEKA
jgi:type I restriction enzyme S subunit